MNQDNKEYNGHKNWTHWNVALWLHNEEVLYITMMNIREYCKNKKVAAGILKELLPPKTPDGASYSISAIVAAFD